MRSRYTPKTPNCKATRPQDERMNRSRSNRTGTLCSFTSTPGPVILDVTSRAAIKSLRTSSSVCCVLNRGGHIDRTQFDLLRLTKPRWRSRASNSRRCQRTEAGSWRVAVPETRRESDLNSRTRRISTVFADSVRASGTHTISRNRARPEDSDWDGLQHARFNQRKSGPRTRPENPYLFAEPGSTL